MTLKTDPNTLAQVSQRLEAYLSQREKICDGGGIITATNGRELLMSDLKILAEEVRHLLNAQPQPVVEVSEVMIDVAMDAYRQCRNSDEPAESRWVEEALLAARTLADPGLAKLTPRQVVPDEMLQSAMEAYRTARNAGTSSDFAWIRAALVSAQASATEPVSTNQVATARKMTP